jgi:hypothetical protein
VIIGGVVLDVPSVIGACRRDPYPEAVVWSTLDTGDVVAIPAAVLAEARIRIPASGRDILDVLLDLPNTVVPTFDQAAATYCAHVLAALPADQRPDLAAAHAVFEATHRSWPVTTDRGALLATLDPTVQIDAMP